MCVQEREIERERDIRERERGGTKRTLIDSIGINLRIVSEEL